MSSAFPAPAMSAEEAERDTENSHPAIISFAPGILIPIQTSSDRVRTAVPEVVLICWYIMHVVSYRSSDLLPESRSSRDL